MVHSVVGVAITDKVKRDAPREANSYSKGKDSNALFSEILEQRIEEQKEAPRSCHTVTYGQDSKLHTFQYQKREYHY